MKLLELLVSVVLLGLASVAQGLSPGNAPPLPINGARIVKVGAEIQLQAAMADLRDGDTILLADGTYTLTSTLYVKERNNVTIRGAAGSPHVVLMGREMDNPNYGDVRFGIWSNGTNTTPYFDHVGGVIRNNLVCLASGLMSARRKAGSDGSLIAWNSPGTQIDHNSILLNGNEYYAIEFRFPTSTNGTAPQQPDRRADPPA
ncbi:MAG: hypothetical protein ACLQVX_22540 [Limisphaerales bacterium]